MGIKRGISHFLLTAANFLKIPTIHPVMLSNFLFISIFGYFPGFGKENIKRRNVLDRPNFIIKWYPTIYRIYLFTEIIRDWPDLLLWLSSFPIFGTIVLSSMSQFSCAEGQQGGVCKKAYLKGSSELTIGFLFDKAIVLIGSTAHELTNFACNWCYGQIRHANSKHVESVKVTVWSKLLEAFHQ